MSPVSFDQTTDCVHEFSTTNSKKWPREKTEIERLALNEQETKKLHDQMDQKVDEAFRFFEIYKKGKDMDAFWQTLTTSVEMAWLCYLGEGKEFNKAATGRGKVTLIKTKTKPPKEIDEDNLATIRNKHSYQAVANLKQAKRLAHVADRIHRINTMQGQ